MQAFVYLHVALNGHLDMYASATGVVLYYIYENHMKNHIVFINSRGVPVFVFLHLQNHDRHWMCLE